MSFGRIPLTSATDLGGMPSDSGSITCTQSLDQVAIQSSGVHFLHPAMNRSSVSAWTWAGAGMVKRCSSEKSFTKGGGSKEGERVKKPSREL